MNLIRLRIPPKEVEFFPMRIFLHYQHINITYAKVKREFYRVSGRLRQ